MEESSIWNELEFRICRELRRLDRDDLRGLWCDGLEPRDYQFDASRPFISGKAWMLWNRPAMEPEIQDWRPVKVKKRGQLLTEWVPIPPPSQRSVDWTFAYWLPIAVRSREAIDWQTLIPAEDVTGWLTIDVQRAVVQIAPATAQRSMG